MTLNFKQLTFIFVFILGINECYSQLGFSNEIGVIAGPVAFQSDFGERSDFATNSGNTGIGIGVVHYINFAYRADCNCYSTDTFFNDHYAMKFLGIRLNLTTSGSGQMPLKLGLMQNV
jgi:hypothetical protein